MKKITLFAAILCGSLLLAGCNTVAGFGQDLKKASAHVSQGLEKAGDKLTAKAEEHS